MSKKVKALISMLVAALLLTMGGVTMVMAEGEEETTPSPEASENALLERVANILGIDEEDLLDAFEQAQQEMGEEAFINRLNQAVAEGLITQEQANEIIKWWEQRPDDAIREWRGQKPEFMEPGMLKHNLRFRSSFRNYQQNGTRWGFCPRAPEETD
ncbi:hypothetical protein ES703_50557 [subsurface metagenome]